MIKFLKNNTFEKIVNVYHISFDRDLKLRLFVTKKEGIAMPVYMDRHDLPGVTAKDVAEAHELDLEVQHLYNCRAITYWFDEERGVAFCLIDAPDKKSVEKLHSNSHGLVPNRIIEVDSTLVEAFLGRIEDPETSNPFGVLRNSAQRTIMVASVISPVLDIQENRQLKELLRSAIKSYGGQVVPYTGIQLLASFLKTESAVKCALNMLETAKKFGNPIMNSTMQLAVGLSVGNPITKKNDLFGESIQLAKRCTFVANKRKIWLTASVLEQLSGKTLRFLSENMSIKTLSRSDEQFLTRLMDTADKIWNQERLTVKEFSKKMGLSKSRLYRQLYALTSYSPSSFIKELRLRKAVQLIRKKEGNIAEVAYETGFNNPSYFSKCFKDRFGVLPSEVANKHHKI